MLRRRASPFQPMKWSRLARCRGAELHATGLTWQQIAEQVGYESGTGAWYAAKRIGYIPAPRVPSLKPGRTCPDCGMPLRGPRPRCEECQRVRILRAAHLRYDLDWSMRDIAREFGYSSGESVRALLKSDAAIEVQHAQPVMMRA